MAAGLLATTVLVFGMPTPGSAAPKPSKSRLKKQLTELEKKVDNLIGTYNAKRVALAKAQDAEKSARKRLSKAESNYETAHSQIADLAGLRYQASDLGMLIVPDLPGSAVLTQVQAEQAALLTSFDEVRDEREKAATAAADLISRLKSESAEVAKQRKAAEDLIDEIKDKIDELIPVGPGRLGNGSWAPELPTGSDNITPRTQLIRAEIKSNFGLRYPVGCYRSGGGGEHPLGRACDFMMSSGGSMPTQDMKAMGDAISAWAIKNGSKLGVKYVIWQQRIYNLGSPGWRGMSNRGGITANHYDHVHISMY